MSSNLNLVFSHRNSGADYVMKSLSANYYCGDFNNNYWHYSDSMYDSIKDSNILLYVIRDGRDVLCDCFEYWRKQPGTKEHFKGKSFRQYLMGYIEAYKDEDLFQKTAETKNPLDPKMFSDPVQYWIEHVNGYIENNIGRMYFVNYDRMFMDSVNMLMHIGEYFRLEPKNKLIESLEDLNIYTPSIKNIGKWRQVFDTKEAEYFWGKAEEIMIKLKYSYN